MKTTAVRVPLREPLKWPGGVRESASGLIVELHTDEGPIGIGEAPGPTLPTVQTIIERELSQFLVGQDPLRIAWLVHRMEEYSRNWEAIAAVIGASGSTPRPSSSARSAAAKTSRSAMPA